MNSHDWCTLRVSRARSIADGVLELRLSCPDDLPLPAWEPGAHLEIETEHGIRQYSLCGSPDDPAYTIAILREAVGRGGSAYLHDHAVVGTELRVRGPRNRFELVADADSYLLIAGGIGITPIKAMAQALHRAGRPWHLHYGGRTATSMAYVQELLELAPEAVTIHAQDQMGLPDLEAIVAATPADTVVYCCGPEGLLEAASRATTGDWSRDLHVERFAGTTSTTDSDQSGPEQTDSEQTDDSGFIVELAASGLEVAVLPGQSILEAVREQVPDVDSSCEDGWCGTCETRVLGGIPLHRDTVLTPSEQDSNELMMICVGGAKSPRLTLDL